MRQRHHRQHAALYAKHGVYGAHGVVGGRYDQDDLEAMSANEVKTLWTAAWEQADDSWYDKGLQDEYGNKNQAIWDLLTWLGRHPE